VRETGKIATRSTTVTRETGDGIDGAQTTVSGPHRGIQVEPTGFYSESSSRIPVWKVTRSTAPVVSIVITTHFRNDTLPDAIESALDQTHDPTEVVVVDDSGTRNAEPVVEDYDVDFVAHEDNVGHVRSWETGIEATDGRYVQFLDDDDRLSPRKVSTQLPLLEGSDETGVAYCGVTHSDGRTARPEPGTKGDVLHEALSLRFRAAMTSSLLVERELLESIRPLPRYPAATDLPLLIELARRTEFDYVDEPLVWRRVDEDSQGSTMAAVDARWQIIEDYDDQYDSVPDDVRRRAVASAGYFEKRIRLKNSLWSARAVRASWRSARADPDRWLLGYADVLATLFGAPGYAVGRMVVDGLRSASGSE